MMNHRKTHFILFLAAIFMLAISCKSTPKPPDQEALDRLNEAMARAENARNKASEVQGQTYFPEEWDAAEADYQAGMAADKETLVGVNEAIDRFNAAADGFEAIAEKSAPLYARDLEEARAALEAVMARVGQSRQNAMDNQGASYFPDDWNSTEAQWQRGESANRETLDGIKTAIAAFTAAADGYDSIAERAGPLYAADREAARKALQEATARAEQSRKEAQDVQAATYFPEDWKNAEDGLQSGKDAAKDTLDEMRAAEALFITAADMYDDLAERSRPLFASEAAQKALDAAIARAERSRQQAMDANGQNFFANDWRTAESRLQSARNAPRNSAEEIQAAAALFASAADSYDDIARRSGPMLAKERDDAQKALQAAIARAQASRRAASDANGPTLFPNEWRNAETRNQTATNAKRETVAEMKAAVPLYNTAADAYDDIARRSIEKTAQEARDRAAKERQAAVDAKANVAVEAEFNRADTVYQQAVRDFAAKAFPKATTGFNQSATQFAAATQATGVKRNQADDALAKAKARSEESIALATNVGLALEEEENE
ncbi:MAG: hypothetical protein FWG46_01685 [Treponema sp.]|nr:hypothetical protein [Treponema sp.]